jgi:hypothetical protein
VWVGRFSPGRLLAYIEDEREHLVDVDGVDIQLWPQKDFRRDTSCAACWVASDVARTGEATSGALVTPSEMLATQVDGSDHVDDTFQTSPGRSWEASAEVCRRAERCS